MMSHYVRILRPLRPFWSPPCSQLHISAESRHRRREVRLPVKRAFDASGKEIPLIKTGLEGQDQARDLAKEAQQKYVSGRRKHNSRDLGHVHSVMGELKPLQQESEESEKPRPDLDDHLPEGFKLEDLPRFEKIQAWDKSNGVVKKLLHQMSRVHKNDDTVVLEGKRMIVDAIRAGFYPDIFVFSRLNLLADIPFDKCQELALYQIPYRNISLWSELKTPPGLMACFSQRSIEAKVAERCHTAQKLPVTLLLDNVRGPDNMGAILRVAAAIGCKRVIATKGCVDAWQSKALRAGAGAHFHLPIVTNVGWEDIHRHIPQYPQVVMADLVNKQSDNPEDEPRLDEATLGQKLASLDARSQGFQYSHTEMETITMEDGGEKGEEVEVPKGKPVMKDMSYHELEILQEYTKLPLVSKRYDQFEPYAASQEWVVVIGGETEGISGAAIKFTHAHLGERIFVPLRCEIDSLNVVSATSVILFEIQRQLERKLSQEQSKSRENMT